ncbi:hypothetical protein A0H81_11905 [Grifola frondosa]|uniref:Uncharacterized protein n=1 Tax=Grifola frondosa TaxID=5627 RepID=A0A1C7LU21_GRIFR|nr:hypothetical protein A0H81_11905 [Grifola frondosa]
MSDSLFSTLATKGIPGPLPTLSFGPKKVKHTYANLALHARHKPLPTTPPAAVSSRQVISLLNLLERMDDDVASEVQRVKDAIKEAGLMIEECREAQAARREVLLERQARERGETKGVDDDFWLGV